MFEEATEALSNTPSAHCQTLGELVALQRGYDLTSDEREAGCIPVIGGGGQNGTHAVANVQGPGVVVARSGSGFGNAWWVEHDFWAHNTVMFVKDFKGNDPSYTYYVLDRIDFSTFNSGGAQPSLNRNFIYPIPVHIPSLPEQCKIAEILRTWDEALEKLSALRAAKQDWLTAVTHKLIGSGGVFPDRWDLKPLSTIAIRVRRKNDGGDHPVMTISAKSGFLMQSDKFARDMAGSSVDKYTRMHQGEFAYNKGNSLAAKYGCIYQLDRPTAVVPFVYFCFALKSGLDANFYSHMFAAGALNHQLSRLINSGVRNDGLLNLNVEDFFGCTVPVPPIEDQRRIGEALTTAKHERSLLDEEIEALTQQKRGLMQKLLTGEWPVTLEKED